MTRSSIGEESSPWHHRQHQHHQHPQPKNWMLVMGNHHAVSVQGTRMKQAYFVLTVNDIIITIILQQQQYPWNLPKCHHLLTPRVLLRCISFRLSCLHHLQPLHLLNLYYRNDDIRKAKTTQGELSIHPFLRNHSNFAPHTEFPIIICTIRIRTHDRDTFFFSRYPSSLKHIHTLICIYSVTFDVFL